MKKTITLKDIQCLLSPLYNADESFRIALHIISDMFNIPQTTLLTQSSLPLHNKNIDALMHVLEKHVSDNMPLGYLLPHVSFLDLTLSIKPPVLIPRPETEEICASARDMLYAYKDQSLSVLDMCSGSGCIGLSLASAFNSWHITCADIKPYATTLCHENAMKNKLANVTCVTSDMFEKLPYNSYDLIISNPPYISEKQWHTLESNVKNWEDKDALTCSDEGLSLVTHIASHAPHYLKKESLLSSLDIPQLIFEIGYDQKQSVTHILKKKGYHSISVEKDFLGQNRAVYACYTHTA
jgi:release factor glutamine methyltransferase